MKMLWLVVLTALTFDTFAQEWRSGESKTQLVELFTSEGCNSCPPADRWLTSLKNKKRLFKDFVPVAFHVDYWDYLGWKDRFSTAEFSDRQRQYRQEGLLSQVYTPGILVDSKEWRIWFRGARDIPHIDQKVGELSVTLDQGILDAQFDSKQPHLLNVAYLGMGIESRISAGENRGKKLTHDFVVLNYFSLPGKGAWQIAMPDIPNNGQEQTALAVWVSPRDSQQAIQAIGGYIE